MVELTPATRKLLLWTPRILGILVALFLGVFALDAFEEGRPFLQSLPAFLLHVSPAVVLLLVVAVSWRWEWVGGIVFLALAVLYIASTLHRVDWILVVAVPLAVVGVLFFVSWFHHGELHAD